MEEIKINTAIEEKTKDVLLKAFYVSVIAFNAHHEISKAFGYKGDISEMHKLHLKMKEELEKENPDPGAISFFINQHGVLCGK